MKFIIRNQAQIANKYLRFAKWKIRKLSNKFGKIIYTEIYVQQIAHSPAQYAVTVKMGVPGPDIVVSARSQNLKELMSDLALKIKRHLIKANQRKSY